MNAPSNRAYERFYGAAVTLANRVNKELGECMSVYAAYDTAKSTVKIGVTHTHKVTFHRIDAYKGSASDAEKAILITTCAGLLDACVAAAITPPDDAVIDAAKTAFLEILEGHSDALDSVELLRGLLLEQDEE